MCKRGVWDLEVSHKSASNDEDKAMKFAGHEGDCHPGTPHHVHVKALVCWFTFWGLSRQIHGKFMKFA